MQGLEIIRGLRGLNLVATDLVEVYIITYMYAFLQYIGKSNVGSIWSDSIDSCQYPI